MFQGAGSYISDHEKHLQELITISMISSSFLADELGDIVVGILDNGCERFNGQGAPVDEPDVSIITRAFEQIKTHQGKEKHEQKNFDMMLQMEGLGVMYRRPPGPKPGSC